KFLSGVGVLFLACGISAVASVPANAAQSKSDSASVVQAAPNTDGVSLRIIV
ncbi:MAG: hypothetical protein QOG10_1104, partial [Kribbellaceae bacterium]|nr:hypothetical protein [Kribbellaceae bacterium]